jgi:hypothetical protein
MKARPRHAENRVAEELNKHFALIGASEVCRIPVIGRTGPDLSINELELVLDVKSRLEVPKCYMLPGPSQCGDLIGVPLKLLPFGDMSGLERRPTCKTVEDYYAHMDEWRLKYRRSGITCLALHRPGMPFGMAMFIIHIDNLKEINNRWTKL